MPSAMFIEDENHRFNILSAQSLGASSLKQGWMEIVQDRRLMQDDNRGLMQGVIDNRRSPNSFRFLVEKRSNEAKLTTNKPDGFLSLVAQMASQELIHPIHVLPKITTNNNKYTLKNSYEPLMQDLPCDIHVVNLRTLLNKESEVQGHSIPSEVSSLILHRYGLDCSFPVKAHKCSFNDGQVKITVNFQFKMGTRITD